MNIREKFGLSMTMLFGIPIAGLIFGVLLNILLGQNNEPIGNLLVNALFLTAVFSLIPIFKFSMEELGLKLLRESLWFHIGASSTIFIGYILFYLFVIKISHLKPINNALLLSLLSYLLVVIAEEVFFRGQIYSVIEQRFSAKIALIVSSVLFGLFHASQGLRGIITKTITGALWGIVRFSTGMIYLLIIPIHFTFNVTWLLFEGNWSTPPGWAGYALALGEIILMACILVVNHFRRSSQ